MIIVTSNMEAHRTNAAIRIFFLSEKTRKAKRTNAPINQIFAIRNFQDAIGCTEKIAVTRVQHRRTISRINIGWVAIALKGRGLDKIRQMARKQVIHINGSSGRSVPREAVKLYSIEKGMA